MPLVKVRLNGGEWSYDPEKPLGPAGGFGEVFWGRGVDKAPVAVKRLKVGADAAAHRELRMAEVLSNRDLRHVVPVLDAGQDALSDSYFVIMPRADNSLQDEVDSGRSFTNEEAVQVLTDIASGLQEVSEVTHRDLKPGNVLSIDGRWCVSDFGIARFVEESTATSTLKGFLTAGYAAPEQWRGETATGATDLYALGCIAHTLVGGVPPFPGPSLEDYQRQHLQDVPPTLPTDSTRLRGLVSMLLRKNQRARPSLSRVLLLLQQVTQALDKDEDSKESGLSEVGALVAAAEAAAEATKEAEGRILEQRRVLAEEAVERLSALMTDVFTYIKDEAPVAKVDPDCRTIRLGSGRLHWSASQRPVSVDAFHRSGWAVLAGGVIEVRQDSEEYGGRAASLWYTDAGTGGDLRWYEVAYMTSPWARQRFRDEPIALDADDADAAAAPGIGIHQFAAPLRSIDDEDFATFSHRWMERFAKAAQNKMQYPSTLPES